jgi:hypothetical protein
MVTIVTDIVVFGAQSYVFLKKIHQKREKMLGKRPKCD